MNAALDLAITVALTLAALCAIGPPALRLLRTRRRRFCPGRRTSILRRVVIDLWLQPRPCGYDLSGLPAPDGIITCPECSAAVPARRLLGSFSLRRWPRWAAIALGLVSLTLNAPVMRSGRWVGHLPTTALVAIQHLPADQRPTRIRREFQRRTAANLGALSPFDERLLIPALIRDLRDDDSKWNAHDAMYLLERIGNPAVPLLHDALDSPDLQQRQLAAHLLRNHRAFHPTEQLLRTTIEGLRHDNLFISNATEALDYLMLHIKAADPLLAQALDSDDWQQRFLAAAIFGFAGRATHIDRAAPILIDELLDDDRSCNAKIATGALYGFGNAVAPWLDPLRQSADPQQRRLIRAILADLEAAAAGKPQAPGPWHQHPGNLALRNVYVPWWWRR